MNISVSMTTTASSSQSASEVATTSTVQPTSRTSASDDDAASVSRAATSATSAAWSFDSHPTGLTALHDVSERPPSSSLGCLVGSILCTLVLVMGLTVLVGLLLRRRRLLFWKKRRDSWRLSRGLEQAPAQLGPSTRSRSLVFQPWTISKSGNASPTETEVGQRKTASPDNQTQAPGRGFCRGDWPQSEEEEKEADRNAVSGYMDMAQGSRPQSNVYVNLHCCHGTANTSVISDAHLPEQGPFPAKREPVTAAGRPRETGDEELKNDSSTRCRQTDIYSCLRLDHSSSECQYSTLATAAS